MRAIKRTPRGIWPKFSIRSWTFNATTANAHIHGSVRAGGGYIITPEADELLNREIDPFSDRERARLTTMLMDLRKLGEDRPTVTAQLVNIAVRAPDMPEQKRADRLLTVLGDRSETIGQRIPLARSQSGDYTREQIEAMVASESVDDMEINSILKKLASDDLIQLSRFGAGFVAQVTEKGQTRIDMIKNVQPARPRLGFNLTSDTEGSDGQ